jgi:hypothetical protein
MSLRNNIVFRETQYVAADSETIISGWTDLRVSYELNRAGMISASIPLDELLRQGWNRTISTVGRFLLYRSGYGGSVDQYGIVTTATIRNGIFELTAESPLAFAKKKGASFGDMQDVAPGTVLKSAIDQMNDHLGNRSKLYYTNNASYLTAGYIDTTSKKVSISATPSMDVYNELFPMLTTEIDMELDTSGYGVVYAPRIGQDRSAEIVLRNQQEGGHIISYSVSTDLYSVTNQYRGIGLERRVTKSAAATGTQRSTTTRQKPSGGTKATTASAGSQTVEWVQSNWGVSDVASYTKWGALRERRDYPNRRSQAAMERQLGYEIAKTRFLYADIEVEIVDPGLNVIPFMGTGDTVTVAISSGLTYKARILARSLDVPRGVMSLALRSTTEI